MEEKWVVAAKRADFAAIGKQFGIDPVIARVMRNRGLTDPEQMRVYLQGTKEDLHDPHLLKDADKAAKILEKKIRQKKKIRIIGDYDIDGIEATYILLKGLERAGATADTVIPDRIADGYGLNAHLVTRAYEDGVDTILTCDNGISAIAQIAQAKELGMTVVVTDHHDIPFAEENGVRRELSCGADAVVNPKQADCPYPYKGLCGAAVAFKLICILYERMGIPASEADIFLENAGFATVGDVMELTGENRTLVKLGLEMLNRTQNPGMQALIRQNGLQFGEIKSYHIGFKLGPCLNASGRLDTAKLSLRLLLCADAREAEDLARQIVELNEERKLLTAQAAEEAEKQIRERRYEKDKVLVLFLPDCHESLAGIVAGRIRENHHRPALVVTRGEEGAKGSGRSIEGYSMYEELCRCRDLFDKFGGHPMAAGFSMKEEDIGRLRRELNENADLTEDSLIPKVTIDVVMPADYIYPGLVEQLGMLEPFGKGNEKPVFADRNLTIESLRVLGREGRVVRMRLANERGARMDAVYFGDPQKLWLSIRQKYGKVVADDTVAGRCTHAVTLHFLYYPEIDHYYEQPRLQLKITGFRG